MRNQELATLLDNMGTLLEIRGDNVFKIKAYFKAAENIRALGEDIADVADANRLSDIPGVGKTLQEKIVEWLATDQLSAYETLIETVPATLLDIVKVPSVGPKKAKLFFDKLKVTNLDDLQKAIDSGDLSGLPGIKEKTLSNITKGIKVVRQGQERMTVAKASRVAQLMVDYLKSVKGVTRVECAGSYRRGRETVRDIDILVDAKDSQVVMDAFVTSDQMKSVNASGETKSSIITKDDVQIDLRIVDSKSFGAALLYFTGSKNFNIKLRQIAMKQDKKINEYGVFSVDKDDNELECLASQTEKECFKVLGLPDIPPELREDIGMADLFAEDKVQVPKLIKQKDLKGEFHVHSTYSDGRHSIKEMAEKAQSLGYSYLAISDHSYKLRIANGVSEKDLIRKRKEVDEVNASMTDFRVLMGSEVEIDLEGNLDYNDEILSNLDIVIGAIHTGFEQGREALTARLLKVCQNKHINIIAHPTGVHIGKRNPYDIDFKAVCQAAVENNVFLEINSFPIRLDLNSSNAYFARKLGVKFVINTDSHRAEHMDFMRFGVAVARRGWLEKKHVLNSNSLEAVLKMIAK